MSYDRYSPREIPKKSGKDAAGDQGDDDRGDDAGEAGDTAALVNEAARRLLDAIERIERLQDEKASIGDDIQTVKAEIKGMGFDLKAINEILRLRRKDRDEWLEERAILHTYMDALGMDYHGR
jgi:uncharacterized protein (UPF0335 family)